MKVKAVPMIAAGFGLALVAALPFAGPALAQFAPPTQPQLPPPSAASAPATAPQPIEIEALAPHRFILAAREPRLCEPAGRPGTAANVLVTVVTHYTVTDGGLVPMEHVRVPAGWRLVPIAGE